MYYINRASLYFNIRDMDLKEHSVHLHSYFEIIHLLKGRISMQLCSTRHTVNAGDLIYIPANFPHGYRTIDQNDEMIMRIISCCTDIFPLLQKALLKEYPLEPVVTKENIHPDVFYVEKRLSELDLHNNNIPLISSLISLDLCRIFPKLKMTPGKNVFSESLTSEIVAYISNNYSSDLSLDTLSREFGVSKYKISRIFSAELGMNFNEFINSLRINHACYLLLSSHHSVTHIGIDSGFNNQQTFNRVFKKQNNCTPKQYRKLYMNSQVQICV